VGSSLDVASYEADKNYNNYN